MGLFDKLQKKIQDTLQEVAPEDLIKSVQGKIQEAMPGSLLKGMQEKGLADMEARLTLAEVDAMEKQGCDVAELRRKVTERIAREKAEAEARVYKLDGLEPYKRVPRDPESDFYKDVVAKPPLVGREKWREKCLNAPLVYTAVVQAHQGLWVPDDYGEMAAVFVFALDPSRMYDVAWLRETADRIMAMKKSASVPGDCLQFIDRLRDDHSQFCFRLGSSLVGDVEAWCVTKKFSDQTVLPHKCLPFDRIVPFLLLDPPTENHSPILQLLPAKYLL